MNNLLELLYWQSVDFCIHLANLLGISYEGLNILLFTIGYPLVTLLLIFIDLKNKNIHKN